MSRTYRNLISLGASFFMMAAHAGVANDVPSCYAANNMSMTAPASSLELFVLVDQTTPLDTDLQASIKENAGRLIKGGNSFVIAAFSSFGQGKYLEVLNAGTIESGINEKLRENIKVRQLSGFDACLKGQEGFGRKLAAQSLNKALSGSSPLLAKSDVLASLKELSARVRQSSAQRKVVLLASDMLENSGVSSFYANKNVRRIDPAAEMKKAEAAQLIGDFGGARVFVLGAGLVQQSTGGKNKDSGVYRDPQTIGALKQFWTEYFAKSNATLAEFGAPALLVPVR